MQSYLENHLKHFHHQPSRAERWPIAFFEKEGLFMGRILDVRSDQVVASILPDKNLIFRVEGPSIRSRKVNFLSLWDELIEVVLVIYFILLYVLCFILRIHRNVYPRHKAATSKLLLRGNYTHFVNRLRGDGLRVLGAHPQEPCP